MPGVFPVDDEIVEAIAIRVAEHLRLQPLPTPHMLSAQEVAAQYGLTRAWVYAHADELGAKRIGGGRRPRLRFDAAEVARRLVPPDPERPAKPRRRRGRRPAADDRLLPIYGR